LLHADYHEFGILDWLEHIQNQHWRTMDLSLDRVSEVWGRVSNMTDTHGPGYTIVIAGTNGKGSCVSMLNAVFQHGGKTTGAYTSPHLVRYNERILVNGEEASDQEICNAFIRIEESRGSIPLTYFEYGTLCALLIFQNHDVDVSILEVGLGGRLDAVNIVDSDLVLITSIGIDHEQWLGADREQIAAEKAGVIKQKGVVVCADSEVPESVLRISREREAVLLGAGKDYFFEESGQGIHWHSNHPAVPGEWRSLSSLVSPYNGRHQNINLAGVVATLAIASRDTGIAVQDLVSGIGQAAISGRCQIIIERSASLPEVIVDVAHNRDSATELARFLASRRCQGDTYAVFGVLADKLLDQIVEPIRGQVDYWILASLDGERGQTAQQLAVKLMKSVRNPDWRSKSGPVEAYLAAMEMAVPADRIVIFGSFYTVGDIINHIEQASRPA
jgi:dihydrofolate synthase/folylpolyglutamate synthase